MKWRAICACVLACASLAFAPLALAQSSGTGALSSSKAQTTYATYHLKRGEGLADVARKHGVSLGEILRLNRSRLPDRNNPDRVFTGMAVLVPVRRPAATPLQQAKPAQAPVQPKPAVPASVAPKTPDAATVRQPPAAGKPAVSGTAPAPAAPKPPEAKPSSAAPVAEKAEEEPKPVARPARPVPDVKPQRRARNAPVVPSAPSAWTYVIAGALILLCLLGLIAVWKLLRLSAALGGGAVEQPKDTGGLLLVSSRDLGRNARLFWFRAGDKDLFVSTGAETKILSPDSPQAQEVQRPAGEMSPRQTSGRRPRKTPPSSGPETGAD